MDKTGPSIGNGEGCLVFHKKKKERNMRIGDRTGGPGCSSEQKEQPSGGANHEESGSSGPSDSPTPYTEGSPGLETTDPPYNPNCFSTRAHALASTLFALTAIAAIILLVLGVHGHNLRYIIGSCVLMMLSAIEWTVLDFRDPRPPKQPNRLPMGYVSYTLQSKDGINNEIYFVETEIVQ